MAYTEFYVNPSATGASNFNAGSTDGAPVFSADNGNFVSTGTYTVVGGASTAAVQIGMFASIYLNTTTGNTTVVARITNVTATTIVVSTTVRVGAALTAVAGTGNVNIRVGGAWTGPSGASGFPFTYTGTTLFFTSSLKNTNGDFPRCNFKDTTYNITTGITWTQTLATGTLMEGYSSIPGDGGKAIISGSGVTGTSIVLLTLGAGVGSYIKNFIFDNNGDTGTSDGVVVGGSVHTLERIGFYNIRGRGLFITGTNVTCIECEAYNCNISNTANYSGFLATTTATSVGFIRCIAWNNAGSNTSGFIATGVSPTFLGCIAYNNGNIGFKMAITTAGINSRISNCVADKNTSDGIDFSSTSTSALTNYVENCILTRNGGFGINASGASTVPRNTGIYNCMFGTNTSGTIGGLQSWTESNSISLPANQSPFVNADAGDFDLNTSVSAGTSALNAGRGTFLQSASAGFSGTLSYNDIGASQDFQSASTSSEKTFLFC